MAISLANSFSDFAEVRDMFDTINAAYANIKTDKNAIVTRMDSSGFEDIICQSENAAASLMNCMDGACLAYKNFLISRMTHRLMLEDHPRVDIGPNTTSAEVLQKLLVSLFYDMVNNLPSPATVLKNSVSLGSTTAVKNNTNAGSVGTNLYLPGHVAPTVGGMANMYYYNRLTELAKTDTCYIECITDSYSTVGTARGYERFRCSGLPSQPAPFSARYVSDGDGTVTYLSTVQARSVIDLGFDDFTVADTPDDWTIDGGTVGVEINEESTASKVVDGAFAAISGATAKALALTGTSSIYYEITPSLVNGRSQMCLVFLLRKDGASSGTYTISVTGTGYSTVTSTALNAASLTTTYTALVLTVPIPASIPSDLRINIDTSAIGGGNILIDQGGFAEYQYWNGVGLAMYEGEDRFSIGDTYTFTITNDYAGDNQTLFAKALRAQLYSATSPSHVYP